MIYSTLPRTDLNVSKICLGTMTFGEQNTEAEAHEQLDFAVDHGVNILDTAELYAVPSTKENNGLTEKYIGSWLAKPGNRSKMYIATKIAGPSSNLSYIRPECNFNAASIETALEGSLKRLQTDYIDLYQLHWPERKSNFFSTLGYVHDPNDPWVDNFLEVISSLNKMVEQGKIRYWGLSNESAWGVMRALSVSESNQLSRCITVQNPYNLLNRKYEIGLAEVSMREEVRLLAYSPMAFGMLSGKYHQAEISEDARLRKYKKQMGRYLKERSFEATAAYLKVAQQFNLSLAQMSLAFVNQQVFVGTNIIGATSITQLKENIESADIILSKEVLHEIEKVHDEFTYPAP